MRSSDNKNLKGTNGLSIAKGSTLNLLNEYMYKVLLEKKSRCELKLLIYMVIYICIYTTGEKKWPPLRFTKNHFQTYNFHTTKLVIQ